MANKRKKTRQRRAAVGTGTASAPARPVAVQTPQRRAKPARTRPERASREAAPSIALERAPAIAAGVVALIAFVVYALTAERSLPTGDSGDLISSAYVLGIPHPPGYPLYTMLAYLATRLPGVTPAFWANMLSALLDAIAVGVVYLAIYRVVEGARNVRDRRLPYVAAAVGALLLAFSSLFWAYSVVAEVFALNNLFAALLLLLALEWSRRPERVRILWMFMFVLGLSLCNQQTIVLLVPAFVFLAVRGLYVLAQGRAMIRARDFAIAGGAFVAGLVPYLYLPIAASANPPYDWGDPSNWHNFEVDVLRENYGTTALVVGGKPGSIGTNLELLFSSLLHGFVYVGAALALAGLWWAWRNRRAEGVALLVAFAVAGPAFMAYTDTAFPDQLTKGVVARFYILPSVPFAILAGLGAWWLIERTELVPRIASAHRGVAAVAIAAALLVAPAAAAVDHYSTEDRSGDQVALDYAEDLLGPLPPNSLLIMRGDENETSIAYAQNVLHYRTDVIALDAELLKLPTYVAQARREHPSLLIPFTAYDGGVHTSLNTFVQDNLSQRPVYFVGVQEQKNFGKPFDEEIEGIATRLVPKGAAPDEYAFLARNAPRFAALRYPTHAYPSTSWETTIGGDYGYAAFYLGYALEIDGTKAQVPLAEKMFRTAIRLDPTLSQAYRDLGLILRNNGGPPSEIVSAWTTYLRLAPNGSQAAAIRTVLAQLEAKK